MRHIGGLTLEFTAAAQKVPTPARAGDGLTDGWRQRIQDDLAALAGAWTDPEAYEGETHAGPVTLPGRETARVALNEVTVHGWDLARATGQDYPADPGAVAECSGFVGRVRRAGQRRRRPVRAAGHHGRRRDRRSTGWSG